MSAKPTGSAVCAHTMLIWSEGDIILAERENTMMILSFAIRPIIKIMIRKKTISIMSAMCSGNRTSTDVSLTCFLSLTAILAPIIVIQIRIYREISSAHWIGSISTYR